MWEKQLPVLIHAFDFTSPISISNHIYSTFILIPQNTAFICGNKPLLSKESPDVPPQLSWCKTLDLGSWESTAGRLQAQTAEWKCEVLAINPSSFGSSFTCDFSPGTVTQNPISLQVSGSARPQASEFLQQFRVTRKSDHRLHWHIAGFSFPAINIRFLFCILKFLPGTFALISFLQNSWAQTRSCYNTKVSGRLVYLLCSV